MSGFVFLNPILLSGLALAAIPIVIHLLNRRRFRVVEFAPMEYLRQTFKKNRRRVQLEQWLLLATRVMAILLLFFLLARPTLEAGGVLDWMGGGRTSHLIIVDDSLSMGYTSDGKTALEQAREVVDVLLRPDAPDRPSFSLDHQPAKDTVAQRGCRSRGRRDLALLRGIEPTDTLSDAGPLFSAMEDWLRDATYPARVITFLTDGRRAGWDRIPADWAERQAGAGGARPAHPLGRCGERRDGKRSPCCPLERVAGRSLVGGRGGLGGSNSQRWSRIDGRFGSPTPHRSPIDPIRLPAIAPGLTGVVPLVVRFSEPGLHTVTLTLPADRLVEDNERSVVVDAKERLDILLVDGEPGADPFTGEVDYLVAALGVGVGSAEAWSLDVVWDDSWAEPRREPPDLVFLANVTAWSAEMVATLRRWVESGTGAILFPGDQVDAAAWNTALTAPSAGLLPCPLVAPFDESFKGLLVEDVRPSPLLAMRGLKPSALESIPVGRFLVVEEPTDPEHTRVLARWNNPGRSPAAVARTVGKGTVVLWTVTADRAWSDWPVEPSFVFAMRELVAHLARPEGDARNLTAGERWTRQLRTSQVVDQLTIERLAPSASSNVVDSAGSPGSPAEAKPEGTIAERGSRWGGTIVPLERPSEADPAGYTLEWIDTRHAGVFRIGWNEGADVRGDRIAVQPDTRESDLTRWTKEELRACWAPLEWDQLEFGPGRAEGMPLGGSEIWRTLAMGLFGLLMFESMLAAWVGRVR